MRRIVVTVEVYNMASAGKPETTEYPQLQVQMNQRLL